MFSQNGKISKRKPIYRRFVIQPFWIVWKNLEHLVTCGVIFAWVNEHISKMLLSSQYAKVIVDRHPFNCKRSFILIKWNTLNNNFILCSLSAQHPEEPHGARLRRRHAHYRVSLQDVSVCPVSLLRTTGPKAASVSRSKLKPNCRRGQWMCFSSCCWGIHRAKVKKKTNK